jgi:hypothetical protein
MRCNEEKEKMKDLEVNTILSLELQMTNKSMNNNYKSEGFGIQSFEVDLSWVLAELTEVFT